MRWIGTAALRPRTRPALGEHRKGYIFILLTLLPLFYPDASVYIRSYRSEYIALDTAQASDKFVSPSRSCILHEISARNRVYQR